MDQQNKNNGIQVLRAVAALLVLFAHLKYVVNSSSKLIQTSVGAIGVDIFFVISGFVIALSFTNKRSAGLNFLLKRIIRVVPFYWLMSLYYLQFSPTKTTVFNTFFFIPVFNYSTFDTLHPYGWSLSFEMYFYICLGVLAVVWPKNALKILVAFFISLVIILMLFTNSSWFLPRFLGSPLILEFCGGILIFMYYKHINKKTFYVSVCTTIVLGFFVLKAHTLGWHHMIFMDKKLAAARFAIWGIFAISLVILVLSANKVYEIKYPVFLVKLGNASYSLYLIQTYCMLLLSGLVLNNYLKGLLFFTIAIGGSFLLYKFVEQPLTAKLKKIAGV